MSDALIWLQDYYLSLCDGDWEHEYGFKIDTLDNPGWSLHFDLRGTGMDSVKFDDIEVERDQTNWVRCRVKDGAFEGFGGPINLVELISIFRNWVLTRSS